MLQLYLLQLLRHLLISCSQTVKRIAVKLYFLLDFLQVQLEERVVLPELLAESLVEVVQGSVGLQEGHELSLEEASECEKVFCKSSNLFPDRQGGDEGEEFF